MDFLTVHIVSFLRRRYTYLLCAVAGLAFGLVVGWVLWPVQWTGASPADLRSEYKVLIANSLAEDQLLLGESPLSAGAEKILGYMAPEPLQAVNEALTALREADDTSLDYSPAEKELVVSNLLYLQSALAEPPQLRESVELPTTSGPGLATLTAAGGNQFARLFSIVSILVLVIGLGWVSYRIINPKEDEEIPGTVRFNADLELEEREPDD